MTVLLLFKLRPIPRHGQSLLCMVLMLLAGCSTFSSSYKSCHRKLDPHVLLTPSSGQTIKVSIEVACTADERQRGLMHRQSLPPNHGMLFVFPQSEYQSFWMKDTYIPLDMIHLDDKKQIVGIVENAKPHTTESRKIDKPSLYVLEVNAFFARKHGITVGLQATFVDIPYCNP